METKIRKIGNSAGILLSKSILNISQIDEKDPIRLTAIEGKIVIEKVRKPREGWEEQFLKAKALEDTEMFIDDTISNDFDKEEWTW